MACCSPQLTNEERVAIARRVVEKAGGRVPVVVGATFEGSLEQQASLMREVGQFADAAVIITNQIAAMEEVWKDCRNYSSSPHLPTIHSSRGYILTVLNSSLV